MPRSETSINGTGYLDNTMNTKFEFKNRDGVTLAGAMEEPTTPRRGVAIFAHCFSCHKNVHAASRVSKGLRDQGFAVLRFDFTGLGQSEGDFANTNFSTNLEDLRSAINALKEHGLTVDLLVGHSLGGAAVLAVANEFKDVKLVATIGAPSDPAHVLHLFDDATISKIKQDGQAEVSLGGRPFSVRKEFIEDVNKANLLENLANNRKPLLICHSPTDSIVSVDHARKIYEAAKHPKSFVSLDGADHLLRNADDATFVATLVSTWANRYLAAGQEATAEASPTKNTAPESGVLVAERNGGLTQDIYAGTHHLIADEPASVGGANLGGTPYDFLLAALGTCTSMTLRMYAKRKGLEIDEIKVELQHNRIHSDDCETCEDQQALVDQIERIITIKGNLTQSQRDRMLQIADMCPVHRTLMNQKEITSRYA